MTRIRLLGSPGNLKGFEVSGHAGAGTEGNDLVCAAISFLATTCANALESVAGLKPEATQSDAYLKASLPGGRRNSQSDTIMRTFLQGAADLILAYPQHVTLIDAQK